jgi:hypothetical protein
VHHWFELRRVEQCVLAAEVETHTNLIYEQRGGVYAFQSAPAAFEVAEGLALHTSHMLANAERK